MTAYSYHHQHQHSYYSIIIPIFWNFYDGLDFLENLCRSGFWNFFYLLRVFKVFIKKDVHVAPTDPTGGVYGGGVGTGGYPSGT